MQGRDSPDGLSQGTRWYNGFYQIDRYLLNHLIIYLIPWILRTKRILNRWLDEIRWFPLMFPTYISLGFHWTKIWDRKSNCSGDPKNCLIFTRPKSYMNWGAAPANWASQLTGSAEVGSCRLDHGGSLWKASPVRLPCRLSMRCVVCSIVDFQGWGVASPMAAYPSINPSLHVPKFISFSCEIVEWCMISIYTPPDFTTPSCPFLLPLCAGHGEKPAAENRWVGGIAPIGNSVRWTWFLVT